MSVHELLSACNRSIQAELRNAHVTLVHKSSHGAGALAKLATVQGRQVAVKLRAVLVSDEVAAVEVEIGEGVESLNDFPHITVR